MKNIWGILLIMLFYSCQSHQIQNETIMRAEKLLETRPDSAYFLLSSIQHPKKLPKSDYSVWCLISSYSEFKLQKEIKSDSLLKNALSYFDRYRQTKYSSIANFLLGYIKWNKGENNDALVYFKRAEELTKNTNDNKIKGLTAYYISEVYSQDELYTHSLNYIRKSLMYFRLANDIKHQAYSYREIASHYYQLDYPLDSAIHYYDIALKLSKQSNDTFNYYCILLRQGIVLRDKNSELSKNYLVRGIKYFPLQRQYYSAYLAYVYSKLNMNDSADYYLKISLNDTINSPLKIIGLHVAAIIAQNKNDYKNAYLYLEKSYQRRDSTYQDNMRSQLYRIDKQFNLSQKEKENVKLIYYNRTQLIWITLLVILILFGIIVFLFVSNRIKRKNAKLELEKQYLQFDSETIKIQNSQKRELLLIKLTENIFNTLEFNKLKKTFEDSEKQTEFYTQLAKQSMLSTGVWQYYIDQVNYIYDNRIEELKSECEDLSKTDLIVIALVCLKVPIRESLILLNMSKNTMYVRRKTIKKRLDLAPEVDLETWIRETINRGN